LSTVFIRHKIIGKQVVDLAQPALLRKRRIFKVIGFNAEASGDMVSNHLKPMPLFIGEPLATTL
jgi:hypothetical protein